MKRRPQTTTCYCCSVTREPDYTTMFDLGGNQLVDICDPCFTTADKDAWAMMNSEGECDNGGGYQSVYSLDGGARITCHTCLTREYIRRMHDEPNPPMVEFDDSTTAAMDKGIIQGEFDNLKKSFAAAMIVTAMVGFALGWAVGVRDGGNNAMTVMGVK